jgi:predicted dehydrogenase
MKIGLMGGGMMGSTHAEIFSSLQYVKQTNLSEIDKDKSLKIKEKTGCKLLNDIEHFLKEGDFEAVDICLPTFFCEQIILNSLAAGKHILYEKPLTLSFESAKRIRDAIKKIRVQVTLIAQLIRFWPQYRKIREMFSRGELEEIEIVYAYRLSEQTKWGNRFRISEKGGGALYDLHIHDLDFVYALRR